MSSFPTPEIVDAYEAFWQGRNEGPIVHYRHPVEVEDFPAPPDWMGKTMHPDWAGAAKAFDAALAAEDPQRIIDEYVDYAEAFLAAEGFCAEGFARVLPNFGPGVLAAFVSGYSEYTDGTTWFELGRDRPAMTLEQIAEASVADDNPHRRLTELFMTALADRFSGRRLVCMTDLGGALDLLAALHTSNDLLMDLVTDGEKISAAMERLDRLWIDAFDQLDAICTRANGEIRGCWMQLLSRQRFYPLQCDFAAMISPEMFRDFVTPSLRRCASFMGRGIFHLDGPGMVGHLPHVAEVEEILAVQWTPGAGQPDVNDEGWFDLYRRIIDTGRKVILLCFPPDEVRLRRLFSALPAEAFYLLIEGPDRQSGQALLKLRG
jgi:hypothetical protein